MKQQFGALLKKKYSFIKDEVINKLWNNLLEIISKYNLNINNAEILCDGDSSIIYIFDKYVIKILSNGYNIKNYTSKSNYILKPLDELSEIQLFSNLEIPFSVIICDKLNTLDISNTDVKEIVNNLLSDDYAFLDIKKENFGKNSNGDVLLLDYGELFRKDLDPEYEIHKNICISKLTKFINSNTQNNKHMKR